jgi:serine/threonine-protein kinase RsbW
VSIQIVMMLPPKAGSVSLARHTMAEALSIPGVAPDCIHEAEVALSEACSNVLRRVRRDHNFEVLINVGAAELTVHILDSVAGFPAERLLATWPDIHVERDHGLALLTEFADQASFDSEGGRGSVRFKKRLRRGSDAALPPSG